MQPSSLFDGYLVALRWNRRSNSRLELAAASIAGIERVGLIVRCRPKADTYQFNGAGKDLQVVRRQESQRAGFRVKISVRS